MLMRLAAFGLIIWVFISIFYHRLNTNGVVVVIVILLIGYAGNALFGSSGERKSIGEQLRLKKLIPDLTANGEKIRVDFSACEIHTRDHTNRVNASNPEAIFFGSDPIPQFSWGGQPANAGNEVQSVIIFKRENPQTAKIERFLSPVIPQDKKTLSAALDRQRNTTLYVDRADRSRYYFDLDFLADG